MNSQIWSSDFVISLSAIAAVLFGFYAFGSLRRDWRMLRGQFAVGLTLLVFGVAARLIAARVFYYTQASGRVDMLATLHPWILAANFLIAAGIIQCIRLATISRGEWPWLAAVGVSAAAALAVA